MQCQIIIGVAQEIHDEVLHKLEAAEAFVADLQSHLASKTELVHAQNKTIHILQRRLQEKKDKANPKHPFFDPKYAP